MGPLHSFRAPPGARSLRRGPPARRRRPEEFPCHAPFFSRGRSKPPPTFPAPAPAVARPVRPPRRASAATGRGAPDGRLPAAGRRSLPAPAGAAGQPAGPGPARPRAPAQEPRARHAAAGLRPAGARRRLAALAGCPARGLPGTGQRRRRRGTRTIARSRRRPAQGLGHRLAQRSVRPPAGGPGAVPRRRPAGSLEPLAAGTGGGRGGRDREPDPVPRLRLAADGRDDPPGRQGNRSALPELLAVRLRMALRADQVQPLRGKQAPGLPVPGA